jgi:hypothetical protein
MPFTLRLDQCFPVQCVETYNAEPFQGVLYGTRVSAALNVCCRPKTVIRGVDLRSIEDTAVIELLLTRLKRTSRDDFRTQNDRGANPFKGK